MRLRAVVGTAALLGSLMAQGSVNAGADSTTSSGNSFDVSAQLAGRYPIPSGIWVNPCEDPFVYTSDRLATDAGARALTRIRADGVTEYLWEVSCRDPETSAISFVQDFWIGSPTPEDIVLDIMEILPAYLDPPDVEWPNMNEENGWLFVKVPMDFRINNLGPVTVTASVPNVFTGGNVSASATATPATVSFVSGEGGGAQCTALQAAGPYVHAVDDACEYTYQNSSSTAPNGYSFDALTTMDWEITSSPADPTIPATLPTSSGQALPVSEVQAVVTCIGNDC